MNFKEIIPATDRLDKELLEIKGGTSGDGIICDTGTVCEVGETIPDDVIIKNPDPPIYTV